MTDPAVARAAFVQRHLALNHLAHIVARARAELGLREPRGRDARGRYTKAASR